MLAFITPIFWMRKVRLRDRKYLFKVTLTL